METSGICYKKGERLLFKMKISVVIPIFLATLDHVQITRDCIFSLNKQYNELIIVDNDSSMFAPEFKYKADKYIKMDRNMGYIKAVNCGIKVATGDYIAIVSNDTILIKGSLQDLCKDGYSFPTILNKEIPFWDGSFYVFPKKLGGLYDERYESYFGDLDKFYNASLKKIPLERIDSVLVKHLKSQTANAISDYRETIYNQDHKIFMDKWNFNPIKDYYTLI